jgi:hypothetical protein
MAFMKPRIAACRPGLIWSEGREKYLAALKLRNPLKSPDFDEKFQGNPSKWKPKIHGKHS